MAYYPRTIPSGSFEEAFKHKTGCSIGNKLLAENLLYSLEPLPKDLAFSRITIAKQAKSAI